MYLAQVPLSLSHVPDHIIIPTPSKLPVAWLFGTGLSLPVAPWILAVMIDPFSLTASKFWDQFRFQFRLTNLPSELGES